MYITYTAYTCVGRSLSFGRFSSFLPFSRLSTLIIFVLTVLQRRLDNGVIIRGTVSMLVCWFCDLNYVGTLVYAELVGRHYGDLDLHGCRARRVPPDRHEHGTDDS